MSKFLAQQKKTSRRDALGDEGSEEWKMAECEHGAYNETDI